MKAGLLHHIELYVSDLSRSKGFWSWLLEEELGYELYQSWDEGFSYKLGQSYIVFVQTQDKYKDIPYHRCGTGLNHLAFLGKSKDHVDQIKSKLAERGVNILYPDKYPDRGIGGHYAVFFEDPDRIKVEIVAPFDGN